MLNRLVLVLEPAVRENPLDGDIAIEAAIESPVNDSNATLSDLPLDLVPFVVHGELRMHVRRGGDLHHTPGRRNIEK